MGKLYLKRGEPIPLDIPSKPKDTGFCSKISVNP